MTMAVSAVRRLWTRQFDFSSAYLNGVLDRPLYMWQPKGFIKQGEEKKVCLMKRGLYGFVQSGHIWYNTLAKEYSFLGYRSSKADPCVRSRTTPNSYSITTTHTDDVFSASSDDNEANKVVSEFAEKWDLKEVDNLNLLLGLTIERMDNGAISISQSTYFERAFKHFGIWDDLYPLDTPLPPNAKIVARDDPLSVDEVNFMKGKPFRQILGCLLWGASSSRPDISFACSALGSIQLNPGPEHWELLMGVCRYIKGTIDYGLLYRPPSLGEDGAGSGLKPLGYVDADWAGCINTRRSTSGYVFFMGGAPVSWSSKRQSVVALSSTESEYIALTRGAQQAMWMKYWLDEVDLPEDFPFELFCDNLGAISLTETTKAHGLSKHLQIRFHYIRDRVEADEIHVKAISTHDNIADIFTKALPKATHRKFVTQMNLDWRRHARGSVEENAGADKS